MINFNKPDTFSISKKAFHLSGSGLLMAIVASLLVTVFQAVASPIGTINQSIVTGTLSTDIRDGTYTTVSSPAFSLGATTIQPICQTSTGTYGSSSQRIYVDNPGAANNGWTLTIAATGGATAKWTSGSDQYDFDDSTGAGCTNGQLTLDPSASTLTADTGATTGITKGTQTSFVSNNSITLLTADASSDDIWRGYLTGIGISQKIPASTPAGSYSLDLTQTIIAT